MRLTCNHCHAELDCMIAKDVDGWKTVCPKCGETIPVTVPSGRIIMAFTDKIEGDEPYKFFTEKFDGEGIISYYAFDSTEEFIQKWDELSEEPDGMWYWVLDNGECICSGACDPYDIDIFMDYFKCDQSGKSTEM